jgi:separase
MLVARPEISAPNLVAELSATLDSPSTFSLLSWLPDCSLLPSKHLDSLLTRAYTTLTKLCNSPATLTKPQLKSRLAVSTTSHEAFFSLRMYALRCLAHTSPGVVEGNVFWDQATKFTSILVKSIPATSSSAAEERITSLVLRAFAELVQIAETRSDKELFMTVDETGKNFIAFCDYWSSFAKRVRSFVLSSASRLIS